MIVLCYFLKVIWQICKTASTKARTEHVISHNWIINWRKGGAQFFILEWLTITTLVKFHGNLLGEQKECLHNGKGQNLAIKSLTVPPGCELKLWGVGVATLPLVGWLYVIRRNKSCYCCYCMLCRCSLPPFGQPAVPDKMKNTYPRISSCNGLVLSNL